MVGSTTTSTSTTTLASLRRCLARRNSDKPPQRAFAPLPALSQDRLNASLADTPLDTARLRRWASTAAANDDKQKTVLYLAYGSNLCAATFQGARGIRPLSQANVVVPSLRLTFDLRGVPYTEPCFANTALRSPQESPPNTMKTSTMTTTDYHKTRWHKGLVGVVYEVTLADYAHIIATEGGGAAYKDILVDCHILAAGPSVPDTPTSSAFKAHTLFAPGRLTGIRPVADYAQPSARYLKLITDGAAECSLPAEYAAYLADIRPYTITSWGQVVGKLLFLALWLPFLQLLFAVSHLLQDDSGRVPAWWAKVSTAFFSSMWASYDGVFRRAFGDGERTFGQDEEEGVAWLAGGSGLGHGIEQVEKLGLLRDMEAETARLEG